MSKGKLFVGMLLGVTLFLSACEPRKEPIEKKLDRTGQPIQITTFVYSSQRELDAAFAARHSNENDPHSRYGFAIWYEWRDADGNLVEKDEEKVCEIHILEPKYIDDEATLTLGHEMLHCLYGSYHNE